MSLDVSYIANLKLAASKMSGPNRRAFQAQITIQYCDGNARKAERIFGWGRKNVEQGLHEIRTGIVCLGSQKGRSGKKRWEDKYPEVAATLLKLAESCSQQDPSFRTTLLYTRLTAEKARNQLKKMGFSDHVIPARRSMSDILNRNGYRLRRVVKSKPKKNS